MADLQRIEQVLDKLKAASRSERYGVLEEYHALIKSGLTLEEGLRAIESSLEFPEPQYSNEDNRSAVIGYIESSGFPREHGLAAIPRILELYPLLSEKARLAAIWLLREIPEREGAEAVMTLVRQHVRDGDMPDFAFSGHNFPPAHAEVYFPELLDYIPLLPENDFTIFTIWYMCLRYWEQKILKPEQMIAHTHLVLSEYKKLRTKLMRAQSRKNGFTKPSYIADRGTAGLLLDLLRFFPNDDVKRAISTGLQKFRDPVLLCWACVAALWLELPVEMETIALIAANDESRKPFYEMLKKQDRTDVFPEQYRTKVAFARSDLVGWLTHPGELGRVPDELELTHIVEETIGENTYEWYLFRFRSRQWARESDADPTIWMAGWSGAFPKADPPGKELTPGDTFSEFNDWDSVSPEDHLGLNAEDEDGSTRSFKVIPVT